MFPKRCNCNCNICRRLSFYDWDTDNLCNKETTGRRDPCLCMRMDVFNAKPVNCPRRSRLRGGGGGRGAGSRGSVSATDNIMQALRDTNIFKLGVCGRDDDDIMSLLTIVQRRVTRDNLFDLTVEVSINRNPERTRIQREIADKLGLCLQGQAENYAAQLYDHIKSVPKILFICTCLHQRLELDELGIPFGLDHQGCKLLLTTGSEEVLTHMATDRTIIL